MAYAEYWTVRETIPIRGVIVEVEGMVREAWPIRSEQTDTDYRREVEISRVRDITGQDISSMISQRAWDELTVKLAELEAV